MAYIKAKPVLKKLEQAAKEKKVLYISGAIGMGKTAAAEYYFRRKHSIFLSGEEGYLNDMPVIEDDDKSALIIDDISDITDEESRKYILNNIKPEKRQIVLIGRGRAPDWLMRLSVKYNFMLADDEDLALAEEDIASIFAHSKTGFHPDSDEFKFIVDKCWHNTLLLLNVASRMPKEETFADSFIEPAKQDLFRYMDHVFFERLDGPMQKAVLELCIFDEFNSDLVRAVTADPLPGALLEKMLQIGHFLRHGSNGNYLFGPMCKEYFLWKLNISYTQKEIDEIYDRAAVYYELNGEALEALKCYKSSSNEKRMADLLTKVVEDDPCMKNFRETKEYFEMLPPAVVEEDPALMSGMSTLYSLAMDPDRSDLWYNKLKSYHDNKDERSSDYKKADSLLRFLDITLYHREKKDLIEHFRHMDDDFSGENLGDIYQQMSMIDFTPSIINGTLELSDPLLLFSDIVNDPDTKKKLENYFAKVMGPHGAGFLDLALAEYYYECCKMDSYDLNMTANELYMRSDVSGDHEASFVCVSLLMRDYLNNGNPDVARSTLLTFYDKAVAGKMDSLMPGLDILKIRLDMYQGDIQPAQEWLETAPITTGLFSILDRQLYITKVKILITLCRYEEALALIGRLEPVFDHYHRPLNAIQNHLLKAVLLYRTNDKKWQDAFDDALKIANHYGYFRVISEEGAAISTLMKEYSGEFKSTDYYKQLKELTDSRAHHYPNYMQSFKAIDESLTKMEHNVIRLMCSELSSEEICETLSISYSGLKFHRQNIYRKFGVNNRNDAQKVAKSLGLNLPQ